MYNTRAVFPIDIIYTSDKHFCVNVQRTLDEKSRRECDNNEKETRV